MAAGSYVYDDVQTAGYLREGLIGQAVAEAVMRIRQIRGPGACPPSEAPKAFPRPAGRFDGANVLDPGQDTGGAIREGDRIAQVSDGRRLGRD